LPEEIAMRACGFQQLAAIALGCLLAAGAVAAETTSPDQAAAANQRDLARLQGTWRAHKLQVGKRIVDVPGRSKKNPGLSLELHGDHYEFQGLGADFKGHVRAASGTKDKRLEFVRDDGTRTISTYRLQGDSLQLTGVSASQNAKGGEEAGQVLIFKREKERQ
jgi:hypothetical protein